MVSAFAVSGELRAAVRRLPLTPPGNQSGNSPDAPLGNALDVELISREAFERAARNVNAVPALFASTPRRETIVRLSSTEVRKDGGALRTPSPIYSFSTSNVVRGAFVCENLVDRIRRLDDANDA